ncbi:MAG: hypothetical protein KIS92_16845 [Planctomycetota bacterium]|nr:hypothetical protein [Planctomycetota bacterium]
MSIFHPKPRPGDSPEYRRLRDSVDNAAIVGSIFIGALLPSLLVWVHRCGAPFRHDGEPWQLSQLVLLQVMAGLGCGLFSFFIAFFFKRKILRDYGEQVELSVLERGAARLGAIVGFLNLPGYYAGFFFPSGWLSIVRIFVLFVVTGVTCGLWIGWQAYRMYHPKEGIWPRFSLRTMMVLVLAWGLLLALFSPEPWPEDGRPLFH